jgi:hypothetical protein
MRRIVDREDAASAGLEEADCRRLEEILHEAGLARLSAADLERQAQRCIEWARAVGAARRRTS